MKKSNTLKFISIFLVCLLIYQQTGFAQVASVELNLAGHFASLQNTLTPDKFRPLHLRSISYDSLKNNFKLLLDKGDSKLNTTINQQDPKNPRTGELENSTKELFNYFLVGLALPNDSFWVNLRPDSPDNIIDPLLAQTEVGRILLEADLQLKKDTSGATSPNTAEGKVYWDKLYQKAEELYGTQNVTIPTLTRPWIVPDEIIIRESIGLTSTAPDQSSAPSAYVYKATLKVMLEQDYLSANNTPGSSYNQYQFKDEREKQLNEYSSQLIRELIIPKLTKELNTSKRYAPLRQVYYSLILAQWFKARTNSVQFTANSLQANPYTKLINSKNLSNLQSKTPYSPTTYFTAYKENFSKGEYSIKEPRSTPYGQVVRSYFSGGAELNLNIPPIGVSNSTVSSIPAVNPVPASRIILGLEVTFVESGKYIIKRVGSEDPATITVQGEDEDAQEADLQKKLGAINAAHNKQTLPEKVESLKSGGLNRQERRGIIEKYVAGTRQSKGRLDSEESKLIPALESELNGLISGWEESERNNVLKAAQALTDIAMGRFKEKGWDQYEFVRWHDYTHAVKNTIETLKALDKIKGENINLPDEALFLIALAGIFHDFGYFKKDGVLGTIKFKHEQRSQEFVREWARENGFSEKQINLICLIISATEASTSPKYWDQLYASANRFLNNQATAEDETTLEALLGTKAPSKDDLNLLLGCIYGARLIGALDVWDTRPDALWRIAALRQEVTEDMNRLMRDLNISAEEIAVFRAKSKEGNFGEFLKEKAQDKGISEDKFRAGIEELLKLPISPSDVEQILATAGFYKFYADSRVTALLGEGNWEKWISPEAQLNMKINKAVIADAAETKLNTGRLALEDIQAIKIKIAQEYSGQGNVPATSDDFILTNTRHALRGLDITDEDLKVLALRIQQAQDAGDDTVNLTGITLPAGLSSDVVQRKIKNLLGPGLQSGMPAEAGGLDSEESKLIFAMVVALDGRIDEAVDILSQTGDVVVTPDIAKKYLDTRDQDIDRFRSVRSNLAAKLDAMSSGLAILYFGNYKDSVMVRLRFQKEAIIKNIVETSNVGGEIVQHNVQMIFSDEFYRVFISESIGGNAGAGGAGINGVMDRSGRIIAFGNPQILRMEEGLNYEDRLSKGDLFEFLILYKDLSMPENKNAAPYELVYAGGGYYGHKASDSAVQALLSAVDEANKKVKPDRVDAVKNVRTFDELYTFIRLVGDTKKYGAEKLIQIIEQVRKGLLGINYVTRGDGKLSGLREKVENLLENGQDGSFTGPKAQAPLADLERLGRPADQVAEAINNKDKGILNERIGVSAGRLTLEDGDVSIGNTTIGIRVDNSIAGHAEVESGEVLVNLDSLNSDLAQSGLTDAERTEALRRFLAHELTEALALQQKYSESDAHNAGQLAEPMVSSSSRVRKALAPILGDRDQKQAQKPIVQDNTTGTATQASSSNTTAAQASQDNKKGGIDFRTLPIVIQSMDNLKAGLRSIPQNTLQNINLTKEWSDIERLVNSGTTPSSERLKEYFAASYFKGYLDNDTERILSCIADILRMEEETCCLTDPALKDILVVLGLGSNAEELKLALAK